MSREILFKAKRKNWRELPKEDWWVEGYIYKISEELNPFIMRIDRHGESVEIDPETLCQYTGLTDKNGKRIWENDIAEAWSEGVKAVGQVKKRVDGLYIMYPAYQNRAFWGLCPNDAGKTSVTVIGNIFDNPELLE